MHSNVRAAESGCGLAMYVAEHHFGSTIYTVAQSHHVKFVMTLSFAMPHMRRRFCTLVLSFLYVCVCFSLFMFAYEKSLLCKKLTFCARRDVSNGCHI